MASGSYLRAFAISTIVWCVLMFVDSVKVKPKSDDKGNFSLSCKNLRMGQYPFDKVSECKCYFNYHGINVINSL